MKNLFNFATDELSQDAFLRWLLCNCADNDLSEISCQLISLLTNGKLILRQSDIKRVVSRPQLKNMDVVTEICTVDDKKYVIAIEDKTDSNEHNQLTHYNLTLSKLFPNASKIFKCYYKTSQIEKNERQRIIDAGWEIAEYADIVSFWKQHVSSDNLIIRQYSQNIVDQGAVASKLVNFMNQYNGNDKVKLHSRKIDRGYYYIFLDELKDGLMGSENWKENRMWIAVYLGSYQGLLWMYCGFKGAHRCIEIPDCFLESGWWSKDYATIDCVLSDCSEFMADVNSAKLYNALNYALEKLLAVSKKVL